jgi:hypothetical protein
MLVRDERSVLEALSHGRLPDRASIVLHYEVVANIGLGLKRLIRDEHIGLFDCSGS